MAKKKKTNFDIQSVLMYAGGGAIGYYGSKFIEDKLEKPEQKKIVALLPLVAGSAAVLFGGDMLKKIGGGMVGVGVVTTLSTYAKMDGFSRVNLNGAAVSGKHKMIVLGDDIRANSGIELAAYADEVEEYGDGMTSN
jgi:hypothetical protein